MNRLLTRRRRTDAGAAAVEFALILPLFLTLVFGILSFGIVFAQKLTLGNAARQAARFGVVADRNCGAIESEVKNSTAGSFVDSDKVDILITRGATASTATAVCDSKNTEDDANLACKGAVDGDSVYATADYTSRIFIFAMPESIVDDSLLVTGNGVFRCEFR